MKIRRGISGEIDKNVWIKFDIEVEEDDLVKVAVERLGSSDTSIFTVKQAYQLLNAEAEIYIAVEASKHVADDAQIEKYRKDIAKNRKVQSDIISKISSQSAEND